MKNLSKNELIEINGGTDNCPLEEGKSFGYYVGYFVGWFFD